MSKTPEEQVEYWRNRAEVAERRARVYAEYIGRLEHAIMGAYGPRGADEIKGFRAASGINPDGSLPDHGKGSE